MLSKHFTFYRRLLCLPSNFHSNRVFSNELALHIRWPKYWSFSFSISPSNKQSGLISFRIDWFRLLAVQGTLKSLLWRHSSKTSVLHCSAFFIVQLSKLYMSTGKTIGLIICTFASKVLSLLFDMLSRFVKGFPGGSDGKESACNVDPLEDSLEMGMFPPSVLDSPLDRGAWQATVHRVARARRMEASERTLHVPQRSCEEQES